MTALDLQIGGEHYKEKPFQPVELWRDLKLNGFQAAIVKYITRHKTKAGAVDIDKAGHFYQLAVELGVFSAPWWQFWRFRSIASRRQLKVLRRYRDANQLTQWEFHAICCVFRVARRNSLAADIYRNWFNSALNRIREENHYLPKV